MSKRGLSRKDVPLGAFGGLLGCLRLFSLAPSRCLSDGLPSLST